MKHAIFDTEGNGLFQFKDKVTGKPIPADAEGQPRLASFCAILLDEADEIQREVMFYVKPDGWAMTPEATAINKLTDEFLNENGLPVVEALKAYTEIINGGYAMVAFGAQHDCKTMRGELRRVGMDDLFEITPNSCLMRSCQGLGIKKLNGKGGWPGLVDVCAHFGIENTAPHQVGADAHAAFQVYLRLKAMGKLQQPAVHRAKGVDDAS